MRQHQQSPGLIYVSPELVEDMMACKYRLGWDTSYHNCLHGLSPFAVPHISLRHQQERLLYKDRLGKALMTTMADIKKGEETPSTSLKSYHRCLQLLSNYIKLLTKIVELQSRHLGRASFQSQSHETPKRHFGFQWFCVSESVMTLSKPAKIIFEPHQSKI
jgi:hypothetical protein